jgi:hypothetical protein
VHAQRSRLNVALLVGRVWRSNALATPESSPRVAREFAARGARVAAVVIDEAGEVRPPFT